ncbi:MAG: hypothetical protein RBU23_03215 [Candidatus Auribacterota bacterium]|nr:hypothetical protein [Candidatus Auribacterota bacterium]
MKLLSKSALFLLVLSVFWTQSVFAVRYNIYDLGEDIAPQFLNENGQVIVQNIAYGGIDYGYNYLWSKNSGYTIIPSPSGSDMEVTGLNNNGMVVGTQYTLDGETHAFVWDNAYGLQLFETLGYESKGTAINDNNQVIGSYYGDEYPLSRGKGFIWSNAGGLTEIGTEGWYETHPQVINNSGVVYGAGESWQESRTMYKYDSVTGTMQNIGVPQYLPSGRYADFYAVNDSGQATGNYETYTGQSAFYYDATRGFVRLYVPFHGDYEVYTWDINNSGKVLGYYYDNEIGQEVGFILTHLEPYLEMITISSGVGSTMPFDLNNLNQVVGGYTNEIYENTAFLWENGTIMNLDALISDPSWTELTFAVAINDNGQMIGSGEKDGVYHGFFMEPYAEWKYIQNASAMFGFTESDIDNLFDLYYQQSATPIQIAGDLWYYTGNEFVGKSIGDAWTEGDYKYIYLGSGLTTNPNLENGYGAPVPEPLSILLLISGIIGLLKRKIS